MSGGDLGAGLSSSSRKRHCRAPTNAAGEPTPSGKEMIRRAVTAERQRLTGKKKRKLAATEAGKSVQRQTPFGTTSGSRNHPLETLGCECSLAISRAVCTLRDLWSPCPKTRRQVTDPRRAGFPQFFVYLQ